MFYYTTHCITLADGSSLRALVEGVGCPLVWCTFQRPMFREETVNNRGMMAGGAEVQGGWSVGWSGETEDVLYMCCRWVEVCLQEVKEVRCHGLSLTLT